MNILVTVPAKGGEIFDSFVPPAVQKRLAEIGNIEYNETAENYTREELRERLKGKDAVITGWGTAKIDGGVLNGGVRIIAHTGGTVQSVADETAYDAGVKIISGNDIYAESVAESVVAYALAALRRIPDYVSGMRNGEWDNSSVWEGLLDKKIGLVGYGMTVRHLIKMLRPFRCEFFVCSSHISDEELRENGLKKASLDEIFENCDIVSLHSAMTPKNYRLINRGFLEKLTPEKILINTARGGIIDEEAMTEMLARGRFRAVLDVFEREPLPEGHPLTKLENAYLIPHRAGPTYDRRKYVTLGLLDDIENFFSGKPLKLEITREYAGYMTR
jgi:phosphoglycerate dehydrogenase-like enzyme